VGARCLATAWSPVPEIALLLDALLQHQQCFTFSHQRIQSKTIKDTPNGLHACKVVK
jgi:hypothetical protein